MKKEKTLWVQDLVDGSDVSLKALVKSSLLQQGKTGKSYLNLTLMDSTGEIEARIWDNVASLANLVVRDALVEVHGKIQMFQGRKQFIVKDARLVRENEVNLADFLPASKVNVEKEWKALEGFIHSMECPYYRGICEIAILENPEVHELMKRAPAAKGMHHAYEAGLIEHIVSVSGILDRISQHYGPKVDRDLLLLGGFFHDIGKLWELTYERTTDYTTEGRLVGHLVMGVELIEASIQKLEMKEGRLPGPFPMEKRLLAKHVVLAHHGKMEYGSPKEPQVLEALIVHMVDDLDSKVNAISEFVKQDVNPGSWTAINRNFNRYFFKHPADRKAAAHSGS